MSKVILAVDDQAEVLQTIDQILGGPYEICAAQTTAKAFAMLHNENFDLILLDVMMPGMTGIEFFEYIKKQKYYENTPVVFLTSEAKMEVVKQALELGARGYVKKPIDPAVLKSTVAKILG